MRIPREAAPPCSPARSKGKSTLYWPSLLIGAGVPAVRFMLAVADMTMSLLLYCTHFPPICPQWSVPIWKGVF